jgi:hypothetical protein
MVRTGDEGPVAVDSEPLAVAMVTGPGEPDEVNPPPPVSAPELHGRHYLIFGMP